MSMISEDTINFISSLEAGSGASPVEWRAGTTLDLFGPPPVPVSRSARPAKGQEQMIQGICGRTYIGSSVPPAGQDSDLLFSWESRLRERLATIGSTESALIWRQKVSPRGQLISRLAPSTRHTNGTGSIGQPSQALARPTPQARDGMPAHSSEYVAKHKANGHGMANLNDYLALTSAWPTPTVADVQGGRKTRSGARNTEPLLNGLMAEASSWTTPCSTESGAREGKYAQGGTALTTQMMHAPSPWVTPSARDWKDSPGMATEAGERNRIDQLPRQMSQEPQASAWPTVTSLSFKDSHQPGNSRSMNRMLDLAEGTALTGPTPSGSSVTTAKRGAPNPIFAFWLMGFPEEWICGALEAMRSYRKQRSKRSAP